MAVPPRLSLVTLGAREVPTLRRFYECLWGPSPSPPGEEFARFELGGAVLAIFALPALAEEVGLPAQSDEDSFAGFTCSINVEEEAMVDEAMAAVREVGGRVLAEPTAQEWGGRSGYFADPETNVWEIAWVPGASFDARGALVWPG